MIKPEQNIPTHSVGLPALLHTVLSTGQKQEMSKEDMTAFHRKFSENITPFIDKHRAEQRRAYTALKNTGI